MKTLLLIIALLFQCSLSAQNKTHVTIKAGESILNVLSMSDIFYYPAFTKGKVFFRNGNIASSKLNYSSLLDEMHFINEKGDTLVLENDKNINFIVVDKDSFYFNEGYVRLVTGNKRIKLGIKEAWKVGDKRKVGAYNTSGANASITSYTSYVGYGRAYNFNVNEDLDLTKVERYFFGDKDNWYLPASKKNMLKLFTKEKKAIEKYLDETNIDFNNKKDLEKLIRFTDQFNVL